MTIRVVTTFGRRQWEDYAHALLPRSMELWPKDVEWQVWQDSRDTAVAIPYVGQKVTMHLLEDDPDHEAFMAGWNRRLAANPALAHFIDHGAGGYLLNAGRFAHKVFTMTNQAARAGADWLIFLGADVETTKAVDSAWLESVLRASEVVHLGRTDIRSSETDFLAFRLAITDKFPHELSAQCFLDSLRHIYTSGDIYQWGEWIDGHIIGRLAAVFEGIGLQVHNLSAGIPGLDVFEKTVLGERLVHHKGPRGKSALQHRLMTEAK